VGLIVAKSPYMLSFRPIPTTIPCLKIWYLQFLNIIIWGYFAKDRGYKVFSVKKNPSWFMKEYPSPAKGGM